MDYVTFLVPFISGKFDDSWSQCKNGVVFSHSHALANAKFRAALPNDNSACFGFKAWIELNAKTTSS